MTQLGMARDQRYRDDMEDRVVAGPVAGGLVVAVFDGHGGSAVAEHAAARALAEVEAAGGGGLAPEALWRRVFDRLDLGQEACGATATLLLLRGRRLTVAWVGDSRAVLVTERGSRVLTPDHRIDRADERRRVLAAGARIMPPYVVDPATLQGLMVTRALGDRALRRVGVIAEPEVATVGLEPGDVGFVAATDGLWDVVGSDEAAEVCRRQAPQPAADRLLELVVERDGSDNVTVVVGRF